MLLPGLILLLNAYSITLWNNSSRFGNVKKGRLRDIWIHFLVQVTCKNFFCDLVFYCSIFQVQDLTTYFGFSLLPKSPSENTQIHVNSLYIKKCISLSSSQMLSFIVNPKMIYDHSKLHITSIVSGRNGIVCQNEDPRQVVCLKWPNKPLENMEGVAKA